MVAFLKDLILHFSIILSLGFMYNFLWMQKRYTYKLHIFKLSILAALLLTMALPVRFHGGMEFDLKLIPIFIAYFYLGRTDSFLLVAVLLLLQGFLEIEKLGVTSINYAVILILFFAIEKMYKDTSVKKKIALGLFVYALITSTRLAALINSGNAEDYLYLLVFSLVSFIALSVTIYIIEMTNFQLQMMHELHKAEKFSAISQLAASVAHEIRNPMTTIRGFMQVLQGERNLSADQNLFISISLQELDRTQTIIDNFLSLAKPNTGGMVKINLSRLLREIIDFMRSYSHLANTELVEGIEKNLWIKGDAHEIRQVFINILKNGIEAMPGGGSIYIIAKIDKDYVKVQFRDEGVGMKKAQLERLGNPYYSTKEKGTGLGLMISYDIIQRMRGKIVVDSEEGKGTTFTILLPCE
ncbi:ATP-binding protein [Mesobacillus subterraneus]|jgi:two-component system, sporulation sensor kinase B|uniref:ATP-binding protein n=1 Tax=Mesobacillus subterraneus TaxID=285983 RepID=UPI0020419B79|nr:ATP-binding protein [Mesobacillus subterraneus]MCM3666798.1 ATP-binding protein [Mesobacillus subterraneus]MCM3685693.1 ATP-binding protein [Mesobacillus subterraneus]